MDVKIRVAAADEVPNVRAWCRANGVGKTAFYKWRARYLADGVEGLADRSRRPSRSPNRTDPGIEEAIVRLRKTLTDEGLHNGADTIVWHLERAGLGPPSASTVHGVLRRHGLVVAEPAKRPRSSWKSFERARPNECWQIDATKWALADGSIVEIIDIIDDHSRVIVAAHAVTVTTAELAWHTFTAAAARWGLPAELLSDNGAPFTARTFTGSLELCHVHTIRSRPYHPQTCGKIERFHQTLKGWLEHQPPARTLDELQRQLDRFIEIYNHHRPHSSIGHITPAARWHATPAAQPAGPRVTHTQPVISRHTITAIGLLELHPWRINLGKQHAHRNVTVYRHDLDLLVFHNSELIHTRTINPDQPYQPSQRVRDVPRDNRPRCPAR